MLGSTHGHTGQPGTANKTPPPPSSLVNQDDDIRLMREVAARNCSAFECLYSRYASRLIAFLKRYVGEPELCEEIFQEVMLVVWRRAADFQTGFRVSTWLFGIARRKALEARSQVAKTTRVPDPRPLTSSYEQDAEEVLLQQERRHAIARGLERLPPDQRMALTLAFYHSYSFQEISAQTGSPVSTVKSQMRQARHRLSMYLEQWR